MKYISLPLATIIILSCGSDAEDKAKDSGVPDSGTVDAPVLFDGYVGPDAQPMDQPIWYDGQICGDNICGPGETCNGCPDDCGICCGNGLCESGYGETSTSCPDDCQPVPPAAWITIPPPGTTMPVTFTMGSPTSEPCREPGPVVKETQHQVTLTRAFEIWNFEVTQGEFQAQMGYNPSTMAACGAECPVETVTWNEAAAYCNALSAQAGVAECYSCSGSGTSVTCQEATAYSGVKVYDCPGYRLPTEAEWEFAYRAGSTTAFYPSAGNNGQITNCLSADANANKIGWYRDNAAVTYTGCEKIFHPVSGLTCLGTHPKGLMAPNAWGLYDMAGNVMEWCHDRTQYDLGSLAVTDPWGDPSSPQRVQRGGAWKKFAGQLRAASRGGTSASSSNSRYGFRCVRTKNP